jgi:hypothetical protein
MSQGKFLNPNDLAQAILFGLPGWWLIIKRSRSPVMRLVAFASVVVILVTFTKTASRGRLHRSCGADSCVLLAFQFFGKVKIAFVLTRTMVAALWLVPKSIHIYGGADWNDHGGSSLNSMEVQFKAWSPAPGSALEVCLTVNGVNCASVIHGIALPTQVLATPLTVGTTTPGMEYWTDATHAIARPEAVQRTGRCEWPHRERRLPCRYGRRLSGFGERA